MDFLIIIGLVVFIVNLVAKANKVQQNAPGRQGAGPAGRQPPPGTPAPGQRPWEQRRAPAEEAPERQLAQGESRMGKDGLPSGSLNYASPEGPRAAATPPPEAEPHVEAPGALAAKGAAHAGAGMSMSGWPAGMTAADMRRAVVMAEILKRPAERQRRWSVR